MRAITIFVLLGAALASGQAAGEKAQTSGSCSPAVVGTNNHITMTCGGISKAKADELVRLMNGILERQIDPQAVYGLLDKIQKELDTFRSAFADPLAGTPPADIELLHHAQRLDKQCEDFISQSYQAKNEALLDYTQKLAEWQKNPQSPRPDPPDTGTVDRERVASFGKEILPQLVAVREKLAAKAPGYTHTVSYSAVNNTLQEQAICQDFVILTGQYQVAMYQEAQKRKFSK